ncbi:MAG: AAA family ATPase, partial [Nitrospirota bacterium]
LRMEIDSMPSELDEIERRVRQLEIEREAVRKEKDEASKARLEKIERELSDLLSERGRLKAQWQAEKEAIQKIRELKGQIETARAESEKAEREGDLARAAELRYGRLIDLDKQIEAENQHLRTLQGNIKMLKEEVDEEDIAEVVSKWTGIPVSKMLEGEIEKLVRMEEKLKERVVGQDEAISIISNAVRRAKAGIQDPDRPLGSFIFMGPTGVGKTELARALAEFLFDDEQAMISIDMSEYMEKHAVSRLIGAPPGYVGFEEGGQLTEAVRRKPYSVILFDEIEKAHHDVFNILLQVLDDGRLTDGKGKMADFKNTVVIMTSNIGSQHIQELGGRDETEMRGLATAALKAEFRPEFLNRIDDIIIFHSLGVEELKAIVDIQVKRLRERLMERHIDLLLTEKAKAYLAKEGYDPVFGARPLKRIIQRDILNPIAMNILKGEFRVGDLIEIDEKEMNLIFNRVEQA